MRFCFLLCGGIGVDSDTVWNDMHTSTAARMVSLFFRCLYFMSDSQYLVCSFSCFGNPSVWSDMHTSTAARVISFFLCFLWLSVFHE